jgi:hypothetical protein
MSGMLLLRRERLLDNIAPFRAVVSLPAVSADRLRSDLDPLAGSSEGKHRAGCDHTFEVAGSISPFTFFNYSITLLCWVKQLVSQRHES